MLDIAEIWNKLPWNTTQNSTGWYRVYYELRDLFGNELKNNDGTSMNATYNFSIAVDNEAPTVKNILSVPGLNGYGSNINISVNVTDQTEVSYVYLNLSHPNGSQYILPMSKDQTRTRLNFVEYTYSAVFNRTWTKSLYNFSIYANDTLGTKNRSLTNNFSIQANMSIILNTTTKNLTEDSFLELQDSYLENVGLTNTSFYLIMQIERWNTTATAWNLINATVNETTPRRMNSSNTLNLTKIWDTAGKWFSNSYPGGNYSIYVALLGENRSVLINENSTLMENRVNFSLDIDTIDPEISSISFVPDSNIGYGVNITLNFNVTDNGNLDQVFINISHANTSLYRNLSPVSGNAYSLQFNDTWFAGTYSISIFANDTRSNWVDLNDSYNVWVNATVEVATFKDIYQRNEIVQLNSPYSWWNNTWTYRFPIKVDPLFRNRTGIYVTERINFSQKIAELGFTGTFDTDSIRVVEHFENGTVVVFNSSEGSDKKYLQPYNNWQEPGFSATENAAYRVKWKVNGQIDANRKRIYLVYFDIEENGLKPAISYSLNHSQIIASMTEQNNRNYISTIDIDGTFGGFSQWAPDDCNEVGGGALADFDGDGDYDIADGGDFRVFYKEQQAGVVFASQGPLTPAGWMPNDWGMGFAYGDFDYDGSQDFVMSGNNDIFYLFRGQGNGSFTYESITGMGGNAGLGKDAADFNNDGILDFVSAQSTSARVYLFANDGFGNFTVTNPIDAPGSNPYCLAAGDFDNDGNYDFVVSEGDATNDFRIYYGYGDGTFNATGSLIFRTDNANSGCDVLDIDNDGNDDILFTNETAQDLYKAMGNGNGTFVVSQEFEESNGWTTRNVALPNPDFRPATVTLTTETQSDSSTPSKAFNTGGTEFYSYPLIQVQFYNGTGWEVNSTLVNKTNTSHMLPGQIIDMRNLFTNAGNWNTTLSPYGLYRIYAELRNKYYGILSDQAGVFLNATYEFNISADTIPPNITQIIIQPNLTGYGDSIDVRIYLEEADSDNATLNLTIPGGSSQFVNMERITSFRFDATINQTWKKGVFNLTIKVNDTSGNNQTGNGSFTISADIDVNITTEKDSYLHNQIVRITSPFVWWNDSLTYRVPIEIDSNSQIRFNEYVNVGVNFTEFLADLGLQRTFDNQSIRIVEYYANGSAKKSNKSDSTPLGYLVPYEPTHVSGYDTVDNAYINLSFPVSNQTEANQERYYIIYFDVYENNNNQPIDPVTFAWRYPRYDVDEDGDYEVIIGSYLDNPAFFLDAADYSTEYQTPAGTPQYPDGFTINDVDNDYEPELVICDRGGGEFYVYGSNTPDTYNQEHVSANIGGGCYGISSGDVDQDGIIEIIYVHRGSDEIHIYGWDGSTYVEEAQISTCDSTLPVTVADVDDDGVLEIINGDWSTAGRICIEGWNGTAYVNEWTSSDRGRYWGGFAVYDFDKDGTTEMVAMDYDYINVFEYDSLTGEYNLDWRGSTNYEESHVTDYGDWDGDGWVEFIVTDRNWGYVDVYQYDGAGGYTREWTNQDGNYRNTAKWADIDKDGVWEIVAGENDGTFYVYNQTDQVTPEYLSGSYGTYYASRYGDSAIISGRYDVMAEYKTAQNFTLQDVEATGGNTAISNAVNLGTTDNEIFIVMTVQKYNNLTFLWEWNETIVNDTNATSRTFGSNTLLNLRQIFSNAGDWNTTTYDYGWYRLNVSLTDPNGNTLLDDDNNILTAFYNFTISIDSDAPQITSFTIIPNKTGYGNNITMEITVLDDSPIDEGRIVVSRDGYYQEFNMTPITQLKYRLIWSDGWLPGLYNVTVYINDTIGNLNSTNGTFFLDGNSSSQITVLKDTYFPGETVDLTYVEPWWNEN